MATDFIQLMTTKTDNELQEYIVNRYKYTPKAILAAVDELTVRGKPVSDGELALIKADLAKMAETGKLRTSNSGGIFNWDVNMVDDPEAPEYFTQRTIYIFSIIFGVLFGSILLSFNTRRTERQQGLIEILSFGVGYTALQIWLLSYIPRSTGLTIAFSIGGALIINFFFWPKFIGAETTYRKRPIWAALTIGVLLMIFYFMVLFYFPQA